MNAELAGLADRYKDFYDSNSIEYEDSAGEFKTDDDPRLTGISAAI